MGAGRSELARAIFGADPIASGEVLRDGKKLDIRSPSDAIGHGIAYLSENRKEEGLAIKMRLDQNVTMANLPEVSRRFTIISRAQELKATRNYVEELDIRTPSLEQVINNLSGGNQQKVVVAKWLFRDSRILIFDEPTRGIDVGAKFAIYELMERLARAGRRGDHDLLRAAGDPRHDRPGPGPARGQAHGHPADPRHQPGRDPQLRGGAGSGKRRPARRNHEPKGRKRTHEQRHHAGSSTAGAKTGRRRSSATRSCPSTSS